MKKMPNSEMAHGGQLIVSSRGGVTGFLKCASLGRKRARRAAHRGAQSSATPGPEGREARRSAARGRRNFFTSASCSIGDAKRDRSEPGGSHAN